MPKSSANQHDDINLNNIIFDSPGYIFWKDIEFKYQGCNCNTAMLLGFNTPNDLIGKTDYEVNPKFAAEFTKQDKSVIKNDKQLEVEYEIIHPRTKKLIVLKVEKKPFKDQSGKIIGILAVASDVSDYKVLEKSNNSHSKEGKALTTLVREQDSTYDILEKAVTEITGQCFNSRLSVQQYVDELCSFIKKMIGQMPCYVYWKTKDFKYVYCNDITVELVGLKSASEIRGKTDYDFGWDPELVKEYRKIDEEIIKTGKPKLGFEETLIKNRKKHTILVNKMPMFNKNEEVIGIVGITVDITEQKEAEQLRAEIEKHEAVAGQNKRIKGLTKELLGVVHKFQIETDRGNDRQKELAPYINTKLSKRETQIVYYLSRGKKPKDIAFKLEISPKTVQSIIDSQLFIKLGAHNIGDLIERAQFLELVPSTLE